MEKNQRFYSKLLLFGEHTVIKGSSALAIPYQRYYGNWAFSDTPNTSKVALQNFLVYLKTHAATLELDISTFEKDLKRGLYFKSNILQGYGVGSSGALCAAIFSQYVTKNKKLKYLKNKDFLNIKIKFSVLESFFHGKSSGIDPLICFLQKPILISSDNNIQQVELPTYPKVSNQACFLINTHIPRSTSPLVKYFQQRCESIDFDEKIKKEIAPLANKCIHALLNAETESFFEAIRKLSTFQIETLPNMTPIDFHDIWKKGLEEDAFMLKLCGAGGGGFILGFAKDWEKTQNILQNTDIELVNYL